jgi:hypothetical protein
MAQTNSPSYAAYVGVPQLKPKSRTWAGRVTAFCEEILVGPTADATSGRIAVAPGDCVRMFRIPANHQLIGGSVSWMALGATTAFTVGDFFVCNRFVPLTPTVAASLCNRFVNVTSTWNGATASPDTGVGYLFTCDTDILVTFSYTGQPTGVLVLAMETMLGG